MNQSQLIDEIRARTDGYSKADIALILEVAADVIRDNLHPGNADADAKVEIILPGLGKLVTDQRAARSGRNPKTGETIEIPARRVVVFRPTTKVKELVNLGH
jgi:DNA-binding protein HU-beta